MDTIVFFKFLKSKTSNVVFFYHSLHLLLNYQIIVFNFHIRSSFKNHDIKFYFVRRFYRNDMAISMAAGEFFFELLER